MPAPQPHPPQPKAYQPTT